MPPSQEIAGLIEDSLTTGSFFSAGGWVEVPLDSHGMKLFGQQIICYNATEVEITFAPKFGIEAAEAYSPKKKQKTSQIPTRVAVWDVSGRESSH